MIAKYFGKGIFLNEKEKKDEFDNNKNDDNQNDNNNNILNNNNIIGNYNDPYKNNN